MKSFEYVVPASVEAAAKAGARKGSLIKAGGIDVLDRVKGYIETPDRLVSLHAVAGPRLREIAADKDGLRLGALVTLAQIADSRDVPAALREAALEAATPQVRNLATVGGNLCQRPRCWYYRQQAFVCLKKGGKECFAPAGENRFHAVFDTAPCPIVHPSNLAPALVALGATVVTNRRRLAIEDFFVLPKAHLDRENVLAAGELVTEVVVPRAAGGSAYREGREKESFDWALVAAAVSLEKAGGNVKNVRICLGAVAPVPRRAPAAEKELLGKPLTASAARAAADRAFADATPLTGNAYKLRVGKVILCRAILAAGGEKELD